MIANRILYKNIMILSTPSIYARFGSVIRLFPLELLKNCLHNSSNLYAK